MLLYKSPDCKSLPCPKRLFFKFWCTQSRYGLTNAFQTAFDTYNSVNKARRTRKKTSVPQLCYQQLNQLLRRCGQAVKEHGANDGLFVFDRRHRLCSITHKNPAHARLEKTQMKTCTDKGTLLTQLDPNRLDATQ